MMQRRLRGKGRPGTFAVHLAQPVPVAPVHRGEVQSKKIWDPGIPTWHAQGR